MRARLIEVPWDSGHWGARMGRGPGALLAAGAVERLAAAGHEADVERLALPDPFPTEVGTGFRVAGALAERVRAASWQRRLPLVLSGNCLASAGVLAGLGTGEIGIVWLDAHGDFNTPETTASGFLDGMALAVATGRCWRTAAAGIPGFRPVDPRSVVLVGARDLDPAEGEALEAAGVERVEPGSAETALPAALDRLRERVERVHLHLDLDVLDPSEGRANGYAAPGGLSLAAAREAIRAVRERFRVAAATLSAYDPAYDADGRARAAALELLVEAAG